MSLKIFHIIFIIISAICLLGFAAWTFFAGLPESESNVKILGALGGVAGIGLLVYLAWFIKKSKKIL